MIKPCAAKKLRGGFKIEWFDLNNTEAITGAVLLATTVFGSIAAAVAGVQKKLREYSINFIARAEEKYTPNDGSGKEKHDYVVEKLLSRIPRALRPFFSESQISEIVSGMFQSANLFSEQKIAKLSKQEEIFPDNEYSDEFDAGITGSRDQNAPRDSAPRNRGIKSAYRIFTLRDRTGVVYRVEYRVLKRNHKQE